MAVAPRSAITDVHLAVQKLWSITVTAIIIGEWKCGGARTIYFLWRKAGGEFFRVVVTKKIKASCKKCENEAFLAAALTRVMRAAVSIPAVASVSVLHSAAVGGSVVGVVRPL